MVLVRDFGMGCQERRSRLGETNVWQVSGTLFMEAGREYSHTA